ncbi:MAG: septum formation protein Maf [Bacteroidales bacterium]|nr:septum formation protein Maf [Bacteroidales bacterium]
MHDKLQPFRIILASQSPRRKALLEGLDIRFEVIVKENIEEKPPAGLTKTEIPVWLAWHKSNHYSELLNEKTILITADTIVWINGRELGKPESARHASEMIKLLSGNEHEVVTGVCIRSKKQEISFFSLSKVKFRNITDEEINYYVGKYKPFDKAGAYGIQEWIGFTGIEKIEGSFYNVMGLPVQALYCELLKFIENESV